MKQAILITAYKNLNHLYELVSFFDDDFVVYIHLDKKQDFNSKLLSQITSFKYVKVVSQKFKVNWGGLNHLKSILYLSQEAMKSEEVCYFHLITGHDFPIKPLTYFKDFFSSNKTDYIDIVKLPYKKWREEGYYRLKYFHLYDLLNAKKFRSYIFKLVELQKKYNFSRRYSKKLPELYGGETYWSLTRETLKYVLDYTKDKPQFFRRMRYTFCSEEIYLHTIIMNSPLSTKVKNNSLRYIDWNKRNGNFPANLDENDFEPIMDSKAIFARRFEYPISYKLLKRVKSNIL